MHVTNTNRILNARQPNHEDFNEGRVGDNNTARAKTPRMETGHESNGVHTDAAIEAMAEPTSNEFEHGRTADNDDNMPSGNRMSDVRISLSTAEGQDSNHETQDKSDALTGTEELGSPVPSDITEASVGPKGEESNPNMQDSLDSSTKTGGQGSNIVWGDDADAPTESGKTDLDVVLPPGKPESPNTTQEPDKDAVMGVPTLSHSTESRDPNAGIGSPEIPPGSPRWGGRLEDGEILQENKGAEELDNSDSDIEYVDQECNEEEFPVHIRCVNIVLLLSLRLLKYSKSDTRSPESQT